MGLTGEADSIVAGTDGAMWAALAADPGRIARIATAGTVTYQAVGGFSGFPVNRQPSALAAQGGALWFLLAGGPDTFGRLIPGLPAPALFSLAAGRPTSLAGGHDGALWMTSDADAIVRFDPPAEAAYPLDPASDPSSIAAGADGALWFVHSAGLGRITTAGALTSHPVGAAPDALAAGPAGSLWYAQGATVRRLGDPAAYAAGSPAKALAAGPDGAVWAAVQGGAARIVSGEPVTTVDEDIDPAAQGVAIAPGPDGRMWLALDRSPYLVKITVPPFVDRASIAESDGWVSATVNPNGLPARVTAEVRRGDGTWRDVAAADAAAATTPATVRLRLAQLASGANLVRMTATTSAGSASTNTITVLVATAPPPAPTPAPTPAPGGPVEGASVEVTVVSGQVSYRVPPSSVYRKLTGTATLPLGVLLDTTGGKATVASQVAGATQRANFNGGKFSVAQTSTGMTEMALAGPLACSPSERAQVAQSKKKKKPKKRLLWGSDSGGSFRTRGNGAVATVRGTRWRTVDTCAGTTVYVREGAVSVWPRRGGFSKLVRAGQRLFSPRPR